MQPSLTQTSSIVATGFAVKVSDKQYLDVLDVAVNCSLPSSTFKERRWKSPSKKPSKRSITCRECSDTFNRESHLYSNSYSSLWDTVAYLGIFLGLDLGARINPVEKQQESSIKEIP
jgi:hypothetical protein